MHRSYLFAPRHDAKLVHRVFTAGADAVMLDLEDAVPPDAKPQARRMVAGALRERRAWVRVNALRTELAAADLDAVAPLAAGLRLPKVESAEDVQWVVDRCGSVYPPLICAIESARGLLAAHEIACVEGVRHLSIGGVDLRRDLNTGDGDLPMLHGRSHLVVVSRAAGLAPPIDSVYPQMANEDGLRAQCEFAHSLGFFGKSAIHPRQLPVLHAVFTPSAEEIAWAREVVAAFTAARGAAARLAGGEFVDRPVADRARRARPGRSARTRRADMSAAPEAGRDDRRAAAAEPGRHDGRAAAAERGRRVGVRGFLFSGDGWPYLLVPLIPVAIVLDLGHAAPAAVFVASALGVIPTAALMGRATEELAARSGPGIGGLLNVTFGNAPELIIALFALHAGLHEVVKASLVGSILGNVLLVMGGSMLAGGLRRERQFFDRTAANTQSLMLLLAAAALVMPAAFELMTGGRLPSPADTATKLPADLEHMSIGVAVVLLVVYGAGLIFSLRTHRDLFNPADDDDHVGRAWSTRRSVTMLALAGAAVAVMSEILVGSIQHASESIGVSTFFVGVIVVAVVGNAAEHWVSIYFALRDKMDLSVNIAIGSSAQIALFVAPVLVLLSFAIGPFPMALVFNPLEVGAVLLAVLVAHVVTHEGESTWMEGVQLLAVYLVLGLVFFFV